MFYFTAGTWAQSAVFAIVFSALSSQGIAQDASAPPKVSIAAAYTQDIVDEAQFIGKGEAIDQVEIVARVNGFVEEVAAEDGATVESGDLLFRIEPDSYAATLSARKADLAKAQANLELAQIEFDRKTELVRRGSIAEAEGDVAKANELGAEAEVQAAQAAVQQAELELSYTEVKAPFAGRIGRMEASVGELVGPTTPSLVSLVREAPIYVRFSLTEKQLGDVLERLQKSPSELTHSDTTPNVYLTLSTGTDLDEAGKIVFLDNRISPTTGSISLLAEFPNEKRLILDGAFLTVRIEALQPTQHLLIPQASVQRDQRGDFVLVVNAQQMVEQRYVTLGKQVETAVIVSEGLQAGESVIVEGLQRVRPGVEVDAILAGQQEG
ncbi:Efflux pump periplasmic linker BepF [Roseovarius albus]|uniref:Efflux pump periplasmic linker BepF n=1 Tax=Roseovarius albus TaxID=1247867 RepID=A0A1X6YYW1_9RHOB|nr:efflux RND transporter periplasmic adaptor subunit [Roseovarius albus]SLN34916.1 Efflux pump periplasmic linker BepF [Roseovarius albus]